ncbi:glycosyltransferase family 9 protein [Maribacter sp. HTCC2170]|uniref:glycosyltransferase family 9 protein n=1 Tax=Maribacter sp. (strain HTCC2170 / KCCM 42371) TaxID=313603 RepID=UPI00006BD3DD|nr:glycosyltransferase family 9 protein [Maribacter sp. HTCC2170]EAR02759.1 heptosyltransferase [Maribacter sp. HTCC2170]
MSSYKHLLVIRLSAMGDVAMTVHVLKALTTTYPKLKITVLTRAFFRPIFAEMKNVSVYEAEVKGRHKGLSGLWRLYKELRGLDIDAVADLHNVLRSNILMQFFRLSGTPFLQIDKGRNEKKRLTSLENKVFNPLQSTHQRYADVFDKLKFPISLLAENVLPKKECSSNTISIVGKKDKKWLGIAAFAAFSGKMYPLKLMEEVVQKIDNTNKYKILLFGGGEKEKELLGSWEGKFINCTNMVGRLSFEEELALISNLDVMLSMDSGNAHLASLYGIPTVTLWGVTHPYAGFAPFGQDPQNALLSDRNKFPLIPTSVYGNKVPNGYEKVMETIPPSVVIKKVKQLLG